jgi:hypothetical protein
MGQMFSELLELIAEEIVDYQLLVNYDARKNAMMQKIMEQILVRHPTRAIKIINQDPPLLESFLTCSSLLKGL